MNYKIRYATRFRSYKEIELPFEFETENDAWNMIQILRSDPVSKDVLYYYPTTIG